MESYSNPCHHHQISGSNAKLPSYHHFPCLFGGLWYLMNPYRGHTVLVHMSCYHTGPFPRAPTGRVCSQGTTCKISQLPHGEEKNAVWSRETVNLGAVCLMFRVRARLYLIVLVLVCLVCSSTKFTRNSDANLYTVKFWHQFNQLNQSSFPQT